MSLIKIPRKLKKESVKVEVRYYIRTGKREVLTYPNVKINRWTLKYISKLKTEIKKHEVDLWSKVYRDLTK